LIRGPASVLYGSDALGGVVNVVQKDLPDAQGVPGIRARERECGPTAVASSLRMGHSISKAEVQASAFEECQRAQQR